MKKIYFIGTLMAVFLCSAKCNSTQKDTLPADATSVPTMTNEKVENSTTNSNQEKVFVAEYLANTRGYYLRMVFTDGKIEYTNERDSQKLTTITLDKNQVSELNTLLAAVDLEALPTLKAPTEKRFYDGAAMANLNITTNGKTYNSDTFDHGYPPAPIEKVVQKLVSYLPK